MLTFILRLITRFLMCLSLLMATVGSGPIVCLSVATLTVGCAPMLTLEEVAARNPAAHAATICARPAGVGPDVRIWAYNKAINKIVTDEDRFPLLWFAETADSIHEYSPYAPRSSAQDMPAHFGLVCPNRGSLLSDGLGFLPSTILPGKVPCPIAMTDLFVEPTQQRKPDPRWLADTPPEARSSFLQGVPTAAFPPNCYTLTREGMKRQAEQRAEQIGRDYGRAIGDYQGSFNSVGVMDASRRYEVLRQYPFAFELLQLDLAQKLNAIPDLPTFEDPDTANAALRAFEKGFGGGIDEAQRRALAIDLVWAAAQTMCGNIACAIETAGARALQFAIARVRSMPLFIPGAAGGAGFFMRRLPKASPTTTSTAPTYIEPRMPAPASIARPPSAPPPRTPPSTNAATNAAGAAATRAAPSGQLHHGISERVFKALEKHEKLKGLYKLRDPRFTARAARLKDHNGYQKWHQDLDDEVVEYIEKTPGLDPKKFESWLGKRYRKSDLAERFPGGLGENK